MKRQEAVALSYLEWVRLIGTGAIRLAEGRIFRWRPDRADPVEVVAQLMASSPDLGTSATSFVLAMLEPEVLDPIRQGGINLGQRLNMEAVRSFHSFGDTALAIHSQDAKAAGVAIDLTPIAAGWAAWAEAVETAELQARGEALLALLDVPSCGRFGEAKEWLTNRERHIAPDDIVKARDTMFFGWACVLNAQKVSTGVAPILPAEVKDEADALRRDFDVDQPFLAGAPRLRAFIGGLAAEGERPADLLSMASLKQHERYITKREGAALDLPSLFDDISVLEALNAGAAGFLVQALGERMPGGLIRALKAQGVTRPAAAAVVPSLPIYEADRLAEQIDTAEVAATINQSPSQHLVEVTPLPDRPIVVPPTSEESAGIAVVTNTIVASDAPTVVPGEAVTELLPEVEAPLDSEAPLPQISTPDQLGLNLDRDPMNPDPVSMVGVGSSRSPADGQQADPAPKSKRKVRPSASKGKKSVVQKDSASSH